MSPMPEQKPGRSRQNYATPTNFLDATRRRLGITEFVFDFAAEDHTTVARHYWTAEVDSLAQPIDNWAAWLRHLDGWGWLNPEFADIGKWASRCAAVRALGQRVALLVPAGVGANWFADYVDGHARVLLLNGRLCFIEDWATTIDPASLKPGKGPPRYYTSEPLYPKDCILCLYDPAIPSGYEVWRWKD
jgi:hypothetical protein